MWIAFQFYAVSACPAAGSVSPKPLCPAVVMRMLEIFLLQNECRVARVCKNRCPEVDLSNLLSQISAGQVRCVKIDARQWTQQLFIAKISAARVLILPGIQALGQSCTAAAHLQNTLLDAQQPCKINLKPRCPAVLIRMRKYLFSNAKDLYVLSLKVCTVKEMKTILYKNVYLRY